MIENKLQNLLQKNKDQFHSVIKFDAGHDKIYTFDFTEKNKELEQIDLQNIEEFSHYIIDTLKNHAAKFGFGGYDELRVLYKRSSLFDEGVSEEPRRLHLGIDIWGNEGTEIFAPLDGTVHSYAFNNNYGDYGATIILSHCLEGVYFFTLYGHLSLADIQNIKEGEEIKRGQKFAHFGRPSENGQWPPHLHFQIIYDLPGSKGDYPGVCKLSDREKYLSNCPDPDIILQFNN
ncbi:MAG: peptidoglycan DD-metalloendopeptidase family protein [Bacteroidota bacterium]|nr:peptidoglycan DD-metalloendopeptidase family protein [Bacteroidota bacterium]